MSFIQLSFVPLKGGSELKLSPMTVNTFTGSDGFSAQETQEWKGGVLNPCVFHPEYFCIQLYSLNLRNRASLVIH